MEEGYHHYSLNVVANNLRLFNVGSKEKTDDGGNDKLFVQFKFDDISFDMIGEANNIRDFRAGRSVEIVTSEEELQRKLTENEIVVKIFKGSKEEDNLVGEISCRWPKFIIDQIGKQQIDFTPFFKDHEILKNNKVVGKIELATQIDFKCPEPKADRTNSLLKLDKSGHLEVYNHIKNDIDEKDVFFVVGSNRSYSNIESTDTENSIQERSGRYNAHLNINQFLNMKGKIVSDFRFMENISCGDPNSAPLQSKAKNRCNINKCQAIFGDVPTSDEKGWEGSSESDAPSRGNPCEKLSRLKNIVPTRDPCRCQRTIFGSDFEDDQLPKQASQNNFATLASKKNTKRPKSFPMIPTRLCLNCCHDITYQPANMPCRKCGHNPRKISLLRGSNDDCDIAVHWDENEKSFMKNHGFSQYDHCTCKKRSVDGCVYCAIKKLRGEKEPTRLNSYIKENLVQTRDRVEDVCREVLSKEVPPVKRYKKDCLVKQAEVSKLTKMLGLKGQSAFTSDKLLHSSPYKRCQRFNGQADAKRKLSNHTNEMARMKQNKNLINQTQRTLPKASIKSTVTGTMKSGREKLTNSRGSPATSKSNPGGSRTSKGMKELINMKYDEAKELKHDNCETMKKDWVLEDIRDSKLRKACKKLCEFKPETMWRKTSKPLSKAEYIKKVMQRYSGRYSYTNRSKPVYASVRHQECLKPKPMVPHKMGWLWNLQSTAVAKGWRPGRLKKSIRELMRYFLREFPVDNLPTTEQLRAGQRSFVEPPEDLTPQPTLCVRKEDGKYLITMNPLKDTKTLQTSANPYANTGPIQFKISKSPMEIKRKQVKRCLKEAGFTRCTCGKSISKCVCRSFMEKERLDTAVKNLEILLEVDNLKNVVVLSDTTDSESHLNLEITPPAGMMRPHLHGRRLEPQTTQYDAGDFLMDSRLRTTEQVTAERLQKTSQQRCPGVRKTEPCQPKPPEPKVRKQIPRVSVKPEESSDTDDYVMSHKKAEKRDEMKSNQKNASVGRKTIPNLTFARNKGSIAKALQGKLPPKSNEVRARGGADIPPEGWQLRNDGNHPTMPLFKNAFRATLSRRSVRVTKPMSRWERFKRRQPVRPPWDDTIYLPPSIKCGVPQQKTTLDNDKSPLPNQKESSQTNPLSRFNKNFRKQQMLRYGLKKDKACNTDFEDLEKNANNAGASAKKTSYHRRCTEPANPPLRGRVNSRQSAARC